MKQCYLIILLILLLSCHRRQPSTYQILKATSEKLNQTLPRQIDSITLLQTTVAIQETRFRYLFYLKIDTADYNMREMEEDTKRGQINWVRSNPEMKPMRDMGVTLEYSYSDWNGIHLFTVVVAPENYE